MSSSDKIRKMLGDITDAQVDEFEQKLIKYIEVKAVDEKVVNILNGLKKGIGRNNLLRRIQDYVLGTKNLENICYFALVVDADLDRIADAVIESKDAARIASLAHIIEALDIANEKYTKALIEKLQNALIEMRDAERLYLLAVYCPHANVKKIESTLIEIGNLSVLELFAANVDGAHISKIKKAIEKIGGYTPVIVKNKNRPKSLLDAD